MPAEESRAGLGRLCPRVRLSGLLIRPATLFRRHGDLPGGVLTGSNGGWGTMSFEDPLPM